MSLEPFQSFSIQIALEKIFELTIYCDDVFITFIFPDREYILIADPNYLKHTRAGG